MPAATASMRGRRNAAREAGRALAEEIDLDAEHQQRPLKRAGSLLVLRKDFVHVDRSRQGTSTSPLTELMGRSKGWSNGTAAKLYLALLWRTTNVRPGHAHPLDLTPARIALFADVIGASRRVTNETLRTLEQRGFLRFIAETDRAARKEPDRRIRVRGEQVLCLSDTGGAHPHTAPSSDEDGAWFALGSGLITEGWMATLNGAAIGVLLVMTSRIDNHRPARPIWIASTVIRDWHGFSPGVWKRGVNQLLHYKLIMHYDYEPKDPVAGDPDADQQRAGLDRRVRYSVEIKRDWLAPYADRTAAAAPSFTAQRDPTDRYSYRTAYVPALTITPGRLDQLSDPNGPAAVGAPCRICQQPITSAAHWTHRDRHVCSPTCNHDLKVAAGIKVTTPRPQAPDSDQPAPRRAQPAPDSHAVAGDPCRICGRPIVRSARHSYRNRRVCSKGCNQQLETDHEQGLIGDVDPLAHPAGPATAGDRCRICSTPIATTVAWQHRHRGVCSRDCAARTNG